KEQVTRRVNLMAEEGIEFVTGVAAGTDVTFAELREEYDSIVLATGAGNARDIPLAGRDAAGIHFAVPYL
ncbi:glutamate synthase, partial [Escherichia coli]|nr:glutamate synthase [Escherichia coli]